MTEETKIECPECGRPRSRVTREWLIGAYGLEAVDEFTQYGLICWACPAVESKPGKLNLCTVTQVRVSYHATLTFPRHKLDLETEEEVMKKITVVLSSGDHELHHNNGGLWPRGVGEAALLCHPQYSYDDSYATRLKGPGVLTPTYIIGWINEDKRFDGACVFIKRCEPYPVGPQDGIMPMVSNLCVRDLHRIEGAPIREFL